ncbi:MAG: BON domain-containing protein [Acidimicrobiia bacterium]|nr:BON domain-containing protein [Acidimicrobiia bacterium]
MTTATLTEADLVLRNAVVQQLDWDSQVDASAIGVTAHEGVVTLTGFIDTYAGKLAAERAVKRMRGVRAVANDIHVRLRYARTDADIADDAVKALSLRAALPGTIQITVHNGHVTLTGDVPTLFKSAVAEKAVRHVPGIKGVVNRIHVAPVASTVDVKRQIVRALHREADVDAHGIGVHVSGHTATLTGHVRTWHEHDAAERAAMHAPGISRVDNRIAVSAPGSGVCDEIC